MDEALASLGNMESNPLQIHLSEHAREQLRFRGSTPSEVEQAIRTCEWKPAEFGRLECRLVFPFNQEWNGRRYRTKTVRPIIVEEKGRIVVVTVYVYYA